MKSLKSTFTWLSSPLFWLLFGMVFFLGTCVANCMGWGWYAATYSDEVYICNGSRAYAYHKYKDCVALIRCGSTVKTTALAEAKDHFHRSMCSLCKAEEDSYRDDDEGGWPYGGR